MKNLALVCTLLVGLVAGLVPALAQTTGPQTNYGNAAFLSHASPYALKGAMTHSRHALSALRSHSVDRTLAPANMNDQAERCCTG